MTLQGAEMEAEYQKLKAAIHETVIPASEKGLLLSSLAPIEEKRK